MGPYMFFLMEQAKKENRKFNEVFKDVKGKWELISDAEKQHYRDLFEQDKLRYEREMREWEEKMIREGNNTIVRSRTLKAAIPSRLSQAIKKK